MNNNLQLLGMLALLALASLLAAREVRRVFRSREPKGHAQLAADQLAYAQRQYLLHQALTEEHRALAEMFRGQAMRLTDYVAANPVPLTVAVRWQRGDLKSMITPERAELPHAELRKTWKAGDLWQWRFVGAGDKDWRSLPKTLEPEWSPLCEYRDCTQSSADAVARVYAAP